MSNSYVLTADRLNNIIRRSSKKLGNDGELVHMVLAGEEWLALEHFGENAARAPDIHLHVVLLPREHNLRRSVVSCRDIACHLWVLYTGKAKIANLEIAVLVDQDIARLQVTMDDTGRVHVFQATLIKSVTTCDNASLPRTRI